MYILFNLSPSGIEGCKVRYDKEKGLYIENKLTKQWALYYSHDLKEKRDDLVEFFTRPREKLMKRYMRSFHCTRRGY